MSAIAPTSKVYWTEDITLDPSLNSFIYTRRIHDSADIASTTLSANASPSATSITVPNTASIYGGEELKISDGTSTEKVYTTYVSAGAPNNTIYLESALVYAHTSGVTISINAKNLVSLEVSPTSTYSLGYT